MNEHPGTPNDPLARFRAPAIALTATLVALAGCGQVPPTATSAVPPSTSPSISPTEASPSASGSGSPGSSGSPSATPSRSATPSVSATAKDGPAVKATGTLKLYAQASKKLAGTCRTTGGNPTIVLGDHKNDFFQTIDTALVLNPAKKSVSKLTIDLGEDSELITRTLSYDAAKPAAGSSAVLTSQGSTYKVTGKLASKEDGKDAGTMPVTLTVVCAGSDW